MNKVADNNRQRRRQHTKASFWSVTKNTIFGLSVLSHQRRTRETRKASSMSNFMCVYNFYCLTLASSLVSQVKEMELQEISSMLPMVLKLSLQSAITKNESLVTNLVAEVILTVQNAVGDKSNTPEKSFLFTKLVTSQSKTKLILTRPNQLN